MTGYGTTRTSADVRLGSAKRTIADIDHAALTNAIYEDTPLAHSPTQATSDLWHRLASLRCADLDPLKMLPQVGRDHLLGVRTGGAGEVPHLNGCRLAGASSSKKAHFVTAITATL